MPLFLKVKAYVAVTWLKCISGGWTTSTRMHEPVLFPCIFGCQGCSDELRHYLVCPSLWMIVAEVCGPAPPVLIKDRLCLCEPSMQKLHSLTVAHFVYHSTKNDTECFLNNQPQAPAIVQLRAAGFARASKMLVM